MISHLRLQAEQNPVCLEYNMCVLNDFSERAAFRYGIGNVYQMSWKMNSEAKRLVSVGGVALLATALLTSLNHI